MEEEKKEEDEEGRGGSRVRSELVSIYQGRGERDGEGRMKESKELHMRYEM